MLPTSLAVFNLLIRLIFSAHPVRFTNIINSNHLLFANPNFGFGLCPWRGVSCFDKCMFVLENQIHDISQVTTSEGVFIVGITNSDVLIYKLFIRGRSRVNFVCSKFNPPPPQIISFTDYKKSILVFPSLTFIRAF